MSYMGISKWHNHCFVQLIALIGIKCDYQGKAVVKQMVIHEN